jgi:hypothetical protein
VLHDEKRINDQSEHERQHWGDRENAIGARERCGAFKRGGFAERGQMDVGFALS